MDNWTPEKKAAFLERLADTGNIKQSCEDVGIPRSTFYWHMDKDKEFEAEVIAARRQGADVLEAEAFKRALGGSDVLLIFMLKGAKPDVYRENINAKHTLTGPNDGPVRHSVEWGAG